MSGQEEAAYWINHVTQFGGQHLRSATQDMAVWEFWMVDMLAVVLEILTVMILVVYSAIRCVVKICRQITTSRKHQKEETERNGIKKTN